MCVYLHRQGLVWSIAGVGNTEWIYIAREGWCRNRLLVDHENRQINAAAGQLASRCWDRHMHRDFKHRIFGIGHIAADCLVDVCFGFVELCTQRT